MLTQIWSVTDIIFCHFRPFFALLPHYRPQKLKLGKNVKTPGDIMLSHMCTINQDHMMYGSWDIVCKGQSFFVIFGHFYSLTLLTTQKIQILRKIKKTPWDIIIFHFSTTNDYYMRRNGFWDIKHDRQKFLLFQATFCRFNPLTTQWKKFLQVLSF